MLPPETARVFLRDRDNGATRLLTTTSEGEAANGPSWNPVISADGTTVVFESAATDSSTHATSDGRQPGST